MGRSASFIPLLVLAAGASAAPTFGPGVSQGPVSAPTIEEASGLAASVFSRGVLWTHNDSGDSARIFALDVQGRLLGTYLLPGANHTDYEDLGAGPGPVAGVRFLYVGDIGDNGASRGSITVYRVPEPAVYERQRLLPPTRALAGVEALTMQYADGPRNAESLFVDPRTGDLYIATKASGSSRLYRAAVGQLVTGGTITLAFVRTIPLAATRMATGATITPDGSAIALRGNGINRLWSRGPTQSVSAAFAGAFTTLPLASEPQGESIAFDAAGADYFTLSEGDGQPLYRYARTSADGPAPTLTLIAPGAAWCYLDTGSDEGTAWRGADFDDSGWSVGEGQLGYGDGDEATTVSFGGVPSARHATTYFRGAFDFAGSGVSGLRLRLVCDDGAAAYLNGTEIARVNLPPGAGGGAFASGQRGVLEDAWQEFDVPPAALIAGRNVLAVEVHQASAADPDLSFDAQLVATPRPCGSTDFDGDGDAATDADIEAFFAVVGGTPCPTGTCGSTDFDLDGDAATDADIEAFFRVIGGGAC